MNTNTLMALALAPIIGSFLAVAAIRLPRGASLWGRSHCPGCQRRLTALELVPLLSWLARRGRCVGCRGEIGAYYPAVELAALAVAGSAVAALSGTQLWMGLALGWTLLLLSVIDLRDQVLPDAATMPLLAVCLVAAWLNGPGALSDRGLAAAGGWLAFSLLSATYRRLRGRDGLGSGDARLLGAAGAWVGTGGLPLVVLAGSVAGIACVAGLALLRGWRAEQRLPFGPFLAAATWGVWLVGTPGV